ncbi:MAG: T9SS type A sorting domain-containing protein, partial [Flavobacteriales bacterium]|nr:T9SS type A sorting domain-containing protein [Flavobacteriales bacterium]
ITLNVQCSGDVPAPVTGWVNDEADNCSTPVVAFVSDVSDGLSCPETITRTFSVTDVCGNTIDVIQLIVVLDIDTPVFDIAALPAMNSLCDVIPVTATATDNCDGAMDGTPDTAFPITAIGTTTITWTYIDACGNVSTQTQDVIISAIDVTTTMASDLITIVANNTTTGVTYQWIDCDTGLEIAGETNHNYTPTYGGNFAVIITQDGCSDTSTCVASTVGIDNLDIKTLVLYPNPTDGMLNIDFEGEVKSIEVVDMLGRVISIPVSVIEKTVDGSSLTVGKYMIRITTGNDQILVEEFVVHK